MAIRHDLVTDRRMAGRGIAPVSCIVACLALASVVPVSPALAQDTDNTASVSRPVVQALPSPSVANLESALQRLAANPRDVTALVDAGSASIELGDTDAAIGFFSRAADLSPNDPRPKVGMGAALVRSENPYDALMMFEEAERYGASSSLLSGDRGLAWDLVGDNTQAQAFYRQALTRGRNDEVTRRLALSLAISGDRREAEKVLQPLLDRNDPASRRTRAFVLAISGDAKAATDIAQQSMPRDLAERISPYLRYMPRLTAAQQAAAANFGHFPNIADIGKDDPRIAKYNKDGTRRVAQGADATLVPKGEPLGGAKKLSRSEQRELERRQAMEAAEQKKAQERALAASKQAELARLEAERKAAADAQAKAAAEARARALADARAREAAAAQARAAAAAQARAATSPAPAPTRSEQSPAVAMASGIPASAVPATTAAPAASTSRMPEAASGWALPPPLPGTESAPGQVATGTPQPSFSLTLPAPESGSSPSVAAASPSPASWSLPSQAAPDNTGASQIASFGQPAAASQPTTSGELPPIASTAPAATLPPGFAQASASPAAASQPSSPIPQPVQARAPLSVADAFADLAASPTASQVGVASGAVDITKIKPRREEPAKPKAEATPAAKPAPPPKPVHPSRSWVQIATGRDENALGFDWRRLTRSKPELFKGRKAYVAKWGQTKRMVTGPFDSPKAAQDFVSKLKAADVDSFIFTSDEGEAVDPLGT